MAGQAFNFDAQSIARIAAAVRAYERTRGQGGPGRPGSGPSPTPSFWVKLMNGSTANPGQYQWTKYVCLQGTWQAASPAASDTTNYSAQEANNTPGLTGSIVKVEYAGPDASNNPVYIFAASSLPPGGTVREVLQRDDNLNAVWDDVQTP